MDHDLNMKMALYTLSVILIFAWALCFFVYSMATSAFIILVAAVIIGLIGIFKKS